ncbi:uncharacterized protein UTRI_05624 [Ustilago trichophora]|uniref:Uncharacterized protein n=1 Tax=Ustilago trichophora TaxID=86804 RepID=A0A5C3EFL8_9BASI|nr:uncharacterized protein UTRI_05624 [Ustilago trichophora]
MAPMIASAGQTRSRLPPKWMQNASLKSAAPVAKPADRAAALEESPMRWSTHTLANDPNDTIRSRADSTTSTYVDTFAHRRKSRISDLTCVDHLDDAAAVQLTPSEINLPDYKAALTREDERRAIYDDEHDLGPEKSDDDDDAYDDDLAHRIDRLMAATMEALEASNRLVLDTLSSRAKLAQLNAMEAALDSHLDAREAHLHRQIQAVTDMTDFVSKTSAELQRLTSPPAVHASRLALLPQASSRPWLTQRSSNQTPRAHAADSFAYLYAIPAVSAQHRNSNATRRAFSISNYTAVQSSIAEETHHEHDDALITPSIRSGEKDASHTITPSNAVNSGVSSRISTPQKKRSVSYDSRAPGSMKLMTKLAGPSRATSSGFVPSPSMLTAPSLVGGAASTSVSASDVVIADSAFSSAEAESISRPMDSRASSRLTMRPSLMATLRQDPSLSASSLISNATIRPETATRSQLSNVSGLPNYSRSLSLKASADVGATSTAAESTLAALLGMPSAASTSSRTETPSESSYFDSAMEDSISSASPPTPGSMHAIHGVLATPWKPTERADMLTAADAPSTQERSARRSSMQYTNLVSPRASLSLSDRDRAQQLSSQLAELRAERVTWNPQAIGSAETGASGTPMSNSGAGGGGALRALQKLNEMSAAKIAGHSSASGESNNSSKRTSLGLGLPSFSALRPSASRSTSTTIMSPSPSSNVTMSQR